VTEIAVVGPGAVGTFFAAHLAAAGRDVVSCARRPFERYIVESKQLPVEAPAVVLTDPADVEGPVPWVLVAVKAHQTAGAAGWLGRLCDRDTTVVAVQNGVEAVERLTPYVNGAEVIASVVYCGAELAGPGHSLHSSSGHLFVPDIPSSHQLAKLFAGSGAEIRPTADHVTELWRKLGMNVTLNGVTALTDRPTSVVGQPEVRVLAERLLSEAWTVGRAEGADLDDGTMGRLLDGMARHDGITSMLQDRRAGRPTEHDALYGAVVRFGARHGIDTPANEALLGLLAGADPGAQG
jgi:2-dehydropantoate 2-reductase